MIENNNNPGANSSENDTSTIYVFDAKEGMILSSDAKSPDGTIIARSGSRLTMDLILKISNYHILEIEIVNNKNNNKSNSNDSNDNINSSNKQVTPTHTYSGGVTKSTSLSKDPCKVLKEFTYEYNNSIDLLKNNVNKFIMKNMDIDTEELLSLPKQIISQNPNTYMLFDILHSMRNSQDQTYVHCVNVSIIASIIGKWVNLSDNDIKVLSLCGMLHDIGKLLIPEEIVLKPDRLSPGEYKIIQQHVNLGYDKLKPLNIDNRIKEACLYHHEKCDGSGYPLGLKKDQIPEFAKIISIADVYDAMTAKRTYREALCPFDVIKLLYQDAFTKYDPNYMIPFINNIAASYIHNIVELSDGRTAEVIMTQHRAPSQPIVNCNGEFIDLYSHPEIKIVKVIK